MYKLVISILALLLCYLRVDAENTVEVLTPTENDSIHALKEISVSAFKRSGRMWKEAVSFTSIGRREVERLNIVTMKDVSEITPNFYMPAYGSRMTSSIYVRGLGARMDQPVVGLNVDNVPILNKDNYDFDLVDIDRIEVLRGPQSTLFGRNTMGGQINITTISPLAYQGVRLMAEYSRANSWKVAASGYTKISENLGTGLSAYFTSTDGFYRNEYTGEKIDTERQGALRWKAAWRQPDGPWALNNTLGLTVSRQGGYPYASIASGIIAHNDTCFYRRTALTDGLSLSWNNDKVSVAAVTSFQYLDDNMTLDQDFLPLDYFTLTQRRHEWAISQDIVAKGNAGKYRWLGGVFGFWRRTRMWAPVTFKEDGIDALILKHRNEMLPDYPAKWDDDRFVLNSDFKIPTWGVAVYHNSTLVLGAWTLTAGLRFDYEKVTLDYHNDANTSFTTYRRLPDGSELPFSTTPIDIDYNGSLSQSFTQLIPKVAVTYAFPSLMRSIVYASVSKGFKSGGYNTQMFSDVLQQRIMEIMGITATYDVDDIVSYRPEISWNYEVGAHLDLLDSRMKLDGALFFIDCRDQQLTMFPSGLTTGRIMTNAGRTHSYGGEIAVEFSPVNALKLNASWGYTHAEFSKFHSGKADYKGKRLPYAPSNTLYAGASYTFGLPGRSRDIILNVNMRGVGDIWWDEANTVRQPFYAQLGAVAEYRTPDLSVQLWGENLTNTRFDTFYFVSVGNAFVQRGAPWRVGATLRVNFSIDK